MGHRPSRITFDNTTLLSSDASPAVITGGKNPTGKYAPLYARALALSGKENRERNDLNSYFCFTSFRTILLFRKRTACVHPVSIVMVCAKFVLHERCNVFSSYFLLYFIITSGKLNDHCIILYSLFRLYLS